MRRAGNAVAALVFLRKQQPDKSGRHRDTDGYIGRPMRVRVCLGEKEGRLCCLGSTVFMQAKRDEGEVGVCVSEGHGLSFHADHFPLLSPTLVSLIPCSDTHSLPHLSPAS